MQQTSECKYYNILFQLYTCKRPMTIARTVADNSLNSHSSILHVYTQQTAHT
jgi:hypothetical protein